MTKFETAILAEVTRLRQLFAERNIPHINFTVHAEGSTLRDEIKITFTVDGDYNYRSVEGAHIDATVQEFFRRNAWKKANDYLALPNVNQPPEV